MGAIVRMEHRRAVLAATVAVLASLAIPAAAAAKILPPSFHTTKISGEPGQGSLPWSEPRIAVGPDGKYWAVTNIDDELGTTFVFGSSDKGKTFKKAAAPIAGQTAPTPDVDIVVLPTGRIIASELDTAGINFPTSYSDDGGNTWTLSQGATQLADQDRQWFAHGPLNKQTHEYPVYLLYHNLATGQAQHNMFVSTSTDSGETFGPPIPITLPGEDAYSDLQCADSGGPSTIFVNQNDGTIYAEFTTRAAPTPAGDLGGCATVAAGQPFEFNIVAGTRVWLAQSTDGGLTWTNSLAVDDAGTGQIVSMQIAYAGLDTAGRVYVAYPESPKGKKYPDYSGAGVRYRFASPAKDGNLKWSAPRTFAPADANAPGHVLVHVAIGDPGQLMGVYWTGQPQGGGKEPVWHMTAAETNNGLAANPIVTEARISNIPTDVGGASKLMGACKDVGPVSGVINGLACDRSPDVYGIALDPKTCRTTIVWPTRNRKDDPADPDDDKTSAPGSDPGTFVSTQTGGPTLCGPHAGVKTPTGAGGGCRDRIAPVSRFARRRTISARRLHFSGRASDKGCRGANGITAAGKVAKVFVSVAKVKGNGRGKDCRFLTKKGTLAPYRRCRKPTLLRARGARRWSITLSPRGLPAGKYRVVVRAIDASKNKERPTRGRSISRFRIG
jgi:BNR repeat protein